MEDLLVYLFSILLGGYIATLYFNNIENNLYKYKNSIKLSFIIVVLTWILIVLSFYFRLDSLKFICLGVFVFVIIIECIKSFIKLSYFNKEFKIISNNNDYTISRKVKKIMIKESLINVFILLAAPLILIDYLINKVLNCIFR